MSVELIDQSLNLINQCDYTLIENQYSRQKEYIIDHMITSIQRWKTMYSDIKYLLRGVGYDTRLFDPVINALNNDLHPSLYHNLHHYSIDQVCVRWYHAENTMKYVDIKSINRLNYLKKLKMKKPVSIDDVYNKLDYIEDIIDRIEAHFA